MKHIAIRLCIAVFVSAALVFSAVEIRLKNGVTIEGTISSENATFYVVDREGSKLKIFKAMVDTVMQKSASANRSRPKTSRNAAASKGTEEPAAAPAEKVPERATSPARKKRTFTLRNGTSLTGSIIAENQNFFKIDMGGTRLSILKSLVVKIDGEATGQTPEQAAPTAPKIATAKTSPPPDASKDPSRKVRRDESTIVLKNGTTLQGVVLKENANFISIDIDGSKLRVLKSMIESIDKKRYDQPARAIGKVAAGTTSRKHAEKSKDAPKKSPKPPVAKEPEEAKAALTKDNSADDARLIASATPPRKQTTVPERRDDKVSTGSKKRRSSAKEKPLPQPDSGQDLPSPASPAEAVASEASESRKATAVAEAGKSEPVKADTDPTQQKPVSPRGEKKQPSARKDVAAKQPSSTPIPDDQGQQEQARPAEPRPGQPATQEPPQLALTTPASPKALTPKKPPIPREPRSKPGYVYPDSSQPRTSQGTENVPVDKSSKVREARVSEIVLKSSKAADTAKIALAEQEEENMTDEKPRPEVPRSRRKQLIRQLERKDLAERFTAAESLALRGADWALEPLADILDDDREIDPGKRLGSEGPVDSLAAVRVLPLTPGLAAAYALSRIGPRGMERLNSAAGHRKPAVRRHAVAGLTFRRGRRSTEALIRALGDEDLEVQFIAATELREREPVDPLIAALSDRNAGIRKHAVEILGELKAAKAADHIMVALKDHNSGVREKAAYAIGRLEDRRAGELLLSALNDGVSFVRRNAAEALGRIREPRAVEPLINTLKDKSALVRRAAATALGRLRDTRAIEPLSNATRDSDPEVQQAAREALALHTDIGELVEALADTSPFVRKNAQYALFLMTGQPHGTDVEKWRSWWKENKDNLVRTR